MFNWLERSAKLVVYTLIVGFAVYIIALGVYLILENLLG